MENNELCSCGHPSSDHNNADNCSQCDCKELEVDEELKEDVDSEVIEDAKDPDRADWEHEQLLNRDY